MAQTIRHVGLDIDHKFQPLSSDRALAGKPSGASQPLEFAQVSDAGKVPIECNDKLFRRWSIDVTDNRLK